jgi:hypothetical protein
MRRKPIENPKLIGCGTCGTKPGIVLTDEKTFYPGSVHIMNLRIDGRSYEVIEEEGVTISDIEEEFADKLENCNFAELVHVTPMHDETYELNTEDRKWYLVEQGQGYA